MSSKTLLDVPWQAPEGMEKYLCATEIIDFNSEIVRKTTAQVIGDAKDPKEAALRIFYFIRDDIKLGFVCTMEKASTVIERRTGYCVSKATAFVAMLRLINIPARHHFGAYKKEIIKDVEIGGILYKITPEIIRGHPWVDVYLNGKWIAVETTFEKEVTENLRKKQVGIFKDECNFEIDWDGENDVLLPNEFFAGDEGIFESPELYIKDKWYMRMPPMQYWINKNMQRARPKKKKHAI